jgi:hypothetical protein
MRQRTYDVGSAHWLRLLAGSGTVFYREIACVTSDPKFHANLIAETAFPTDSGAFIEVFRLDVRDSPRAVNVDHYNITLVDSIAYIRNCGFNGPGHHCSDLPSSLAYLPSIP